MRAQEIMEHKLAKKKEQEEAWREEDERMKSEIEEQRNLEGQECVEMGMELEFDFAALPADFADEFRTQLAEALGISKDDLVVDGIERATGISVPPSVTTKADNPFEVRRPASPPAPPWPPQAPPAGLLLARERHRLPSSSLSAAGRVQGWTREERVHVNADHNVDDTCKVDVLYHPPEYYVRTTPLIGMLDVAKMHKDGESSQVSSMSVAEFADAFWFERWSKFDRRERERRAFARKVLFFSQQKQAARIQAMFRGRAQRKQAGLQTDYGRCMRQLRESTGGRSFSQMVSTLMNFSTHTPSRGETMEEYCRTTVANSRLKWARENSPPGPYELCVAPAPDGYKYPGGKAKPLIWPV